jgi:hypothetical protein
MRKICTMVVTPDVTTVPLLRPWDCRLSELIHSITHFEEDELLSVKLHPLVHTSIQTLWDVTSLSLTL